MLLRGGQVWEDLLTVPVNMDGMCVGLYFYECFFYGHRQQIVLISVQVHEPEPDGCRGGCPPNLTLTLEALCIQMLKEN